MSDPLQPAAAVAYGNAVCVAYAMYGDGTNLYPQQPDDFPAGYHMTAWIHMSDFAIFGESIMQLYGYVAQNDINEYEHLIVVRGTEGLIEWYDDALCWPILFRPAPSAGNVHFGFDRIYATMRVIPYSRRSPSAVSVRPAEMQGKTFADQIEQLLAMLPATTARPEREHEFSVMGHSLGAALCTLYVMEHATKKRLDLERRVVLNRLCTFGSPRVGMNRFATEFGTIPIDSWRIANLQDLVPKVPLSIPWLLPYHHVPVAYDFSSRGEVKPGFQPACWHSMKTYLHWLDPQTQALDANCKAT